MYLSGCDVKFSGIVLFENNTAENGGGIHTIQETRMTVEDEAIVKFIDNTAKTRWRSYLCGYGVQL